MQSKRSVNTALPPCALCQTDEGIVVGTYDLNKETGTRSGSLDLYTQELDLSYSIPVQSAVLDTKRVGDRIYVAQSNGKVGIYDLSLKFIDDITLGDGLVTQIALEGNYLAGTTTNGGLIVHDINQGSELFRSKIHDLEAWTVAFGGPQASNMLYTGGDDRVLSSTDLRIPYTLWKLKLHEAGVTSILPRGEQMLWTGGYDDCVNEFDIRSRKVLNSKNLGGGVWRLIESPLNTKVLACCMYGGLRMLDSTSFGKVIGSLTNNESMVYGGLWKDEGSGFSCSFYDKMLQKWVV